MKTVSIPLAQLTRQNATFALAFVRRHVADLCCLKKNASKEGIITFYLVSISVMLEKKVRLGINFSGHVSGSGVF